MRFARVQLALQTCLWHIQPVSCNFQCVLKLLRLLDRSRFEIKYFCSNLFDIRPTFAITSALPIGHLVLTCLLRRTATVLLFYCPRPLRYLNFFFAGVARFLFYTSRSENENLACVVLLCSGFSDDVTLVLCGAYQDSTRISTPSSRTFNMGEQGSDLGLLCFQYSQSFSLSY